MLVIMMTDCKRMSSPHVKADTTAQARETYHYKHCCRLRDGRRP